jgi:hypothetical protein
MYPSFNDFDFYSDELWNAREDFEGDEQPETEVIAGVEIRGSVPEDEWDGEELPF